MKRKFILQSIVNYFYRLLVFMYGKSYIYFIQKTTGLHVKFSQSQPPIWEAKEVFYINCKVPLMGDLGGKKPGI
jgi:hypothetical protein